MFRAVILFFSPIFITLCTSQPNTSTTTTSTTTMSTTRMTTTRTTTPYRPPDCSDIIGHYSDLSSVPKNLQVRLLNCLLDTLTNTGNRSAIDLQRPPPEISDKLVANVSNVVLRRFTVNDKPQMCTFDASVVISWTDTRYSWNKNQWLLDTIPLGQGIITSKLWYPSKVNNTFTPFHFVIIQGRNTVATSLVNITASYNGTITLRINAGDTNIQAVKFDYSNYPTRSVQCCSTLAPEIKADGFLFQRIDTTTISDRVSPKDWKIASFAVTAERYAPNPQALQFCVNARKRSSQHVEIYLPQAACAVLLLISWLYPGMKYQLHIQLFAVLVQLLCFTSLTEELPELEFETAVPKAYRFYQITMGFTLFGALCTLLVIACKKQKQQLPPPHRLLLAADIVNRIPFACCSRRKIEPTGEQVVLENTKNKSDIEEIWHAANKLLCIALAIFYVVALFILAGV